VANWIIEDNTLSCNLNCSILVVSRKAWLCQPTKKSSNRVIGQLEPEAVQYQPKLPRVQPVMKKFNRSEGRFRPEVGSSNLNTAIRREANCEREEHLSV